MKKNKELEELKRVLPDFEGKEPLIHCMTNYVAMEFTANVVLAVGGRPLMSFYPDEMEEIVSKCDALSVNIGCLDEMQAEAMKEAVTAAGKYGKSWVLDPVGAWFTRQRLDLCRELIETNMPAVIRGNKTEIDALKPIINKMSKATRMPVIVTSGAVDLIEQGERRIEVMHGSKIMTRVTAMGCTESALIATYLCTGEESFMAAYRAMMLEGMAGEMAADTCRGTGSFKMKYLDILSSLCLPEFQKNDKKR